MEIELESSRLHLLNWNPLEFAGYYTLALKSLFAEAPKLKMKREKENMRKSWIYFASKSQIIESQRISQMIFGSEGSGEAFISFSRRAMPWLRYQPFDPSMEIFRFDQKKNCSWMMKAIGRKAQKISSKVTWRILKSLQSEKAFSSHLVDFVSCRRWNYLK